jgi:hypothetical protein
MVSTTYESGGQVYDLICFGIGLRIALGTSYPNSFEHGLYIYKFGPKKLPIV